MYSLVSFFRLFPASLFLSKSTSNLSKQPFEFLPYTTFASYPNQQTNTKDFPFVLLLVELFFLLTSPCFLLLLLSNVVSEIRHKQNNTTLHVVISFLCVQLDLVILKSLRFLHTSTCYHALVNMNQIFLVV